MKVNASFNKHACFPSYNHSQTFCHISHSVWLPSALFAVVSEQLTTLHEFYIESKCRLCETMDIKHIHNNY